MSYNFDRLTCEDDKLIAFAGIAADMQKVLNEDYFARHWRCHLVYRLSWTASGGGGRP